MFIKLKCVLPTAFVRAAISAALAKNGGPPQHRPSESLPSLREGDKRRIHRYKQRRICCVHERREDSTGAAREGQGARARRRGRVPEESKGAKSGRDLLRVFAAANLSLFLFGSGAALAEDCSPHCDYWHYYGPYDFSYIRPGLFGYPICDQRGDCSPHLYYVYSGHQHGRITIIVRPASKTTQNAH